MDGRSPLAGKSAYTLPPGQHEYAFEFKLPFNNSCFGDKSQAPIMLGLELAKPASQHVKKTLPPTLSGFPGEAEIRYFVKVTVNRHSIFKENPRAYAPFNFFPIEPPRGPITEREIYARQKHQFIALPETELRTKVKGIFGKKADAVGASSAAAPFVSVDARLPEPAILTCNCSVPLRLIVTKLSDSGDIVHLQSLQISLLGHTKIRAHSVYRTETQSWVLLSKSNMNIPIGATSDPNGTQTVLDNRLWRDLPLPNTVAPSFETCNIQRFYQLDLRVGLSYISSSASNKQPQSIVLPLRLDTQVYSGIAPPAEILQRMAHTVPGPRPVHSAPPLKVSVPTAGSEFGAQQIPPTPIDVSDVGMPPALLGTEAGLAPVYADAPPSYEDAVAADLPPVTAPRPEYAPPPQVEDPVLGRDEKRR